MAKFTTGFTETRQLSQASAVRFAPVVSSRRKAVPLEASAELRSTRGSSRSAMVLYGGRYGR